jgi:hypothetical protein
MITDFHLGDQNVQQRINRDVEFHDYLRDKFGLRANDISHIGDPIAFIKNDDGVIFRLKELRFTANGHGHAALRARNMAHVVIDMIEQEVVQ